MLKILIRNFKYWPWKTRFSLFNFSKPLFEFALIPLLVTLWGFFTSANLAIAEESPQVLSEEEKKILNMGISELLQMDVVVTSASKKPQKINETASAIFVVTQEDIRRSGAVNIMEALRIVPGVQVSKINQNRYAISIRGFNRRLGSDKLLVLMDGRTLYSPSAAGVFWLGQDTVLEDIDRIEVIRGPGASLWGSNAVAGVINISTKSSHETKGALVSGGIGSEERGFTSLRYGGPISEGLDFRVYGKYRSRDGGENPNGTDGIDDKEIAQGGFRADWEVDETTDLTFQGDLYNADAGLDFLSRFVSLQQGSTPFQGTTTQKGGNFLSRYNKALSNESNFKAQVYYDRLERESAVPFDNVVDQFDFEFQHDFKIKDTHRVSWGANYRLSNFNFTNTNIVTFPNDLTHLYGFFIHDEIILVPDFLNLIVGSKFEHNQFSGWEIQPNVRTNIRFTEQHSAWAAVSRAVRIPTISEEGALINRAVVPPGAGLPLPLLLTEENQGNLNAESLVAYEAGYRFKLNSKFYFDISGFYFDYNDIIELTQSAPRFNLMPFPPHLQITAQNENSLEGDAYGFELASQWQALPQLKLAGSYSYLDVDLKPTKLNTFIPQSFNSEGDLDAEGEPNHVLSARAYINLLKNLEFDILYYFTSNNSARNVPSFHRLDLRLGWKPIEELELSLVGQNIADEKHFELNELLERATQTERSYYFKATVNF